MTDDYGRRLSIALQGLVPIAWMERAGQRAADPARPTVDEMFPTDAERGQMLEVLTMADGLAIGRPARSSKPGALAALAKALAALSLAPGGVPFLGTRYRTEPVGGGPGVQLVIEEDQGLSALVKREQQT